jgi:hypothetical protein
MITAAIAGVVIIAAIWATVHFTSEPTTVRGDTYYTTDNGASWFALKTDEFPPFNSDGKEAVRVHVFTCPDGKEFAGYLEKYTPEAKAILAELKTFKTTGVQPDMGRIQEATMRGKLVKAIDGKEWLNSIDPRSRDVSSVKCPDGTAALPAK